MPKFACTLPIVGYAYIEIDGVDTEEEAVAAAVMADWAEFEIVEEYVTDHVGQGNVTYHPCHHGYANLMEE